MTLQEAFYEAVAELAAEEVAWMRETYVPESATKPPPPKPDFTVKELYDKIVEIINSDTVQ